jgi:hypothetical protein
MFADVHYDERNPEDRAAVEFLKMGRDYQRVCFWTEIYL